MIAQLLSIILAVTPIPGGDPGARLKLEIKPCAHIRVVLPEVRCVTDRKMLTMHIRSRTDFEDPLVQSVIAKEMLDWFRAGGGTFVLHMRLQDEFMVCMTKPGGFTCWTTQRTTAGVDSEDEVPQDAPTTEGSP